MSTPKQDLEVIECDWDVLSPHFARGRVLEVHPDLSLITAAQAIAEDLAQDVQRWLDHGQLTKPSDDTYRRWIDEHATFQFVIVRPYVLVQQLHAPH